MDETHIYIKNNILYHHDLVKEAYEFYLSHDRTDFVKHATASLGIEPEHAIIMWQVFDITEELTQK